MIRRLEITFRLYTEYISLVEQNKEECNDNIPLNVKRLSSIGLNYFASKDHQIDLDLDIAAKDAISDYAKSALKKKWEVMYDKFGYIPNTDYRVTRSPINPNSTEKVNSTPNRKFENKEENEHKEEEIHDAESIKAKLNEITPQALYKSKTKGYGEKIAFLSKSKQNEEKKRLLLKMKKDKMKQALYNMSEEINIIQEYLDLRRRKIARGEDLLLSFQDENQALKRAQSTQAKKKAPFALIDEVKKMIESSRMLSKINILERRKTKDHGIKALKFDMLGNYIPSDPRVFPTSATSSPTRRMRSLGLSNLTPNSQFGKGITFGTPVTARNSPSSEAIDTSKEIRSYSNFRTTAATTAAYLKFKNLTTPSKSQTLKPDSGGFKQSPRPKETGESIPGPIKSTAHIKSKSQKFPVRIGDLGLETLNLQNKQQVDSIVTPRSEVRFARAKEGPESQNEKNNIGTKPKQKRLSLPEIETGTHEEGASSSSRIDPVVRSVFSSSVFATGLMPTASIDDLNAKLGYK